MPGEGLTRSGPQQRQQRAMLAAASQTWLGDKLASELANAVAIERDRLNVIGREGPLASAQNGVRRSIAQGVEIMRLDEPEPETVRRIAERLGEPCTLPYQFGSDAEPKDSSLQRWRNLFCRFRNHPKGTRDLRQVAFACGSQR